jgi:acyl-CoA synthetase (AMP-forming)/AMP-acid ligase II
MTRLIDLTRPIDEADRALLPAEVGNIFAPRVRSLTPGGDGAAQRLARYKLPTRIAVLAEFPRNATGKAQRSTILAILAEQPPPRSA